LLFLFNAVLVTSLSLIIFIHLISYSAVYVILNFGFAKYTI